MDNYSIDLKIENIYKRQIFNLSEDSSNDSGEKIFEMTVPNSSEEELEPLKRRHPPSSSRRPRRRHPPRKRVIKTVKSWSIFSSIKNKGLDSILDIRKKHNISGKNIRVAILDTGINKDHICLKSKIVEGKNFTSSHSHDYTDRCGHGTHCAGIIAGSDIFFGNNRKVPNIQVGVAPDVELYIGKVLSDDGKGDIRWTVEAIDWAISKEVHIINMSLGYSGILFPEIKSAIDRAIDSHDIIVCCAAGNEGPKPKTLCEPGAYGKCITVGAISSNNRLAWFSSRGSNIDVVAPGVNIASCYIGSPSSFCKMDGTSMAAPFVSGVAALFLEYLANHPDQGRESEEERHQTMCGYFEEFIKENAVDLGTKGFDNLYGSGRINLKLT